MHILFTNYASLDDGMYKMDGEELRKENTKVHVRDEVNEC